jgi:hypothetical protein
MSLLGLLGQTADLFRPTTSPDGFGDAARLTYPDSPNQTVRCRLQLSSGFELTEGREVAVGQAKLFLPPDAVVDEKTRARVDGQTFNVTAVYPVRTPTALHHYECQVETYSGEVPSRG